MKTKEKSFKNFTAKGVSLVDFYADWCGPCRSQESVINALAKRYAGKALVAKVNVDRNRKTAADLGVSSIPTVVLFKDGREIKRFIGVQNEKNLAAALDKALGQQG